MTERIIKYVAVYLVAFMVDLVAAWVMPFVVPMEYFVAYGRATHYFPQVVLFGFLLADMIRLSKNDIDPVVLFGTLFLGLAAPLLYLVISQPGHRAPKGYRKYVLVMSLYGIVELLSFEIPAVGAFWQQKVSMAATLLTNLAVLAMVVVDARQAGLKAGLPWLCTIALAFPTCAVLVLYALMPDGAGRWLDETRLRKRYLIPTAVVAALMFVLNVSILLSTEVTFSLVKSPLLLLLGLFIGIMLLCDTQMKTIPRRGWLYVSGFVFPYLAFPAAIHCLLSSQECDAK